MRVALYVWFGTLSPPGVSQMFWSGCGMCIPGYLPETMIIIINV
jgi:hypothetical protein